MWLGRRRSCGMADMRFVRSSSPRTPRMGRAQIPGLGIAGQVCHDLREGMPPGLFGQARHNRGRRISAARTLARDLPLAAPGRPRPRSFPCSDPRPSSGPPTPPNYPGDQAIELLAWIVPADIATTRRLATPQTTPALTDPAAWRPAPMASPARATHTGSPRRPGQATTRIPAGKCAPPPTSSQRRDRPTQVIGNQFKQVHKWQICVPFRHRRPGTWARKYSAFGAELPQQVHRSGHARLPRK